MKLKIKIVTGFNSDQHYTLDGDEAHKAYYLFEHPEERGIFSNGIALIGKFIQAIQPDYNATMGWNSSYELGGEDWNEIRERGIDKKMNALLEKAKEVNHLVSGNPGLLSQKLTEIQLLDSPQMNSLSDGLSNKLNV